MHLLTRTLLFTALLVLLSSTWSVAAEDSTECEVCIKVVSDVSSVYKELTATEKGNKQDLAEKALNKHCSSKVSSKDNKLCYFLEPLKKDVARQVSYGKAPLKICKNLEKKNPDFCSMRYPVKTDENTDYSKLRVKQLRKILAGRGVDCVGCVEKDEFIAKIKETAHLHEEL